MATGNYMVKSNILNQTRRFIDPPKKKEQKHCLASNNGPDGRFRFLDLTKWTKFDKISAAWHSMAIL